MVLLEAAMHSKPMVSCEIGTGTSWINQNGKTGWVVPPENAAALAKAVNQLVDNPNVAEMMGKNARLRFDTTFTPSIMSRAYHNLYSDLLSSSTVKNS
jgi:rhamnosyl/mannosyltransferase